LLQARNSVTGNGTSGYNLRLVQKQLGHSSIHTTEVYADVMEPDIQDALRELYK